MRYVVALVAILTLTIGGSMIYWNLTQGPPVVLAAPRALEVTTAGGPLLPGGWTNNPSVVFSTSSPSVSGEQMEVEVRPQGQVFSGTPTATASAAGPVHCASTAACPSGRKAVSLAVHLADGSYAWQARLHNDHGVSPWVTYTGIIKVDTRAPAITQLSSPTDPSPKTVYHTSSMRFDWTGADSGSGVSGYAYRLDADPHGQPRPEIRTAQNTVTLTGLDTGTWYFHVRARDVAGNWGPTSSFPVRIDVTPPGLAHVRFSAYYLDPQFDTLGVGFSVTRPAKVVHVGVYRQTDNHLVRLYRLDQPAAGQHVSISWDGKDAQGSFVAPGAYAIYIRATDQFGHSTVQGWRDFVIDYRRIVVSLSQQRLWAYDGNKVVLTSLVTTGNRALPTPTGTFHILGKFHPFTFHSPWPKSSPFYYAPSLTQWAMLFQEGGYFIHDAPWRTAFGPGTNQQVGTPGSNYTGTHGCVNVPGNVAAQLYAWAGIGTVVQVNP